MGDFENNHNFFMISLNQFKALFYIKFISAGLVV